MMSQEEQSLIISYALEDERKLSLALKIGESQLQIRQRIIERFLDGLENALRKQLRAPWSVVDDLKKGFPMKYRDLSLAKTTWQHGYTIALSSDRDEGRSVFWGVKNPAPERRQMQLEIGLRDALNRKHFCRKSFDYWCWWQHPDNNYTDWTRSDVLLKLYKMEPAVRFFEENLLDIIQIAEPLLDRIQQENL